LFPFVWAALLAAPFLSGGLLNIINSLATTLDSPFVIHWSRDSPKCILLFAEAYGMGLGIYYSSRRNYRHREEHGCSTMIKTVGLKLGKFDIKIEAVQPFF
jgi:type IV secretion system protein VirD4